METRRLEPGSSSLGMQWERLMHSSWQQQQQQQHGQSRLVAIIHHRQATAVYLIDGRVQISALEGALLTGPAPTVRWTRPALVLAVVYVTIGRRRYTTRH